MIFVVFIVIFICSVNHEIMLLKTGNDPISPSDIGLARLPYFNQAQ